jgi:transglutaminase-like putative cysteine protease
LYKRLWEAEEERKPGMRKIAVLLGVLVVIAVNAVALEKPAASDKVLLEDWYILKLNGNSSGWAHHRSVETAGEDGKTVIKSEIEEMMSLKMGEAAISITSDGIFIESPDGHMLSYSYSQDDGMVKKITSGRVEGGKLRLNIDSGGQTYQREIDFPDDVIVGYAEELLTRKHGFAPGTTYSYKTYNPELGVQTITRKVVGKEKLEINGAPSELNRIDMLGMMPGVTLSEYRDDNGRAVAAKFPVFNMEFLLELSSAEQVAKIRNKAGTIEGTDIMALRYARIVNSHPRPRRVERAVYLIQPTDGKPFEDLNLSGGGQKARAGKDGIVLEVGYPRKFLAGASKTDNDEGVIPQLGVTTANFVTPTDCPYTACLSSGPYVQSDLPEIKQRARDIVANAKDYLDAARKCEKWVRQNLLFIGSGMNFAPASTILEKRRGDCTEAAVLLASLLRAEAIPCRLVAGVAQLQGIVGFHMWVEVWGGEKGGKEVWIPFDSAVPSGPMVDATHIRLATAADDANVMQSVASLMQVIGRVKITALKYYAGGMEWEDKQPWTVVEKGTLVHKGFLITCPVPAGMILESIAKDGEVKFVDEKDDKHTIRVNVKEIPPEYSFTNTIQDFRRYGWRISFTDFIDYDGRKGVDVVISKNGREVKAIHINDGDALIRIVEEPPVRFSESLKEITKGLRFLTEAGYDEGR